ncbi:hypothetical protein GHO29_17340 [Pseudomonas helleri]|uniref:Uncharacterized protein n=1 Tax=Pseudomonas helleri TaxID=1608996 RepID=A0A7X1Y2S6_9PSED|nr:hypothetical protein [Pseudomonas helleri]MQU28245.1 hypothetical protein [Pseudomonas helleri]
MLEVQSFATIIPLAESETNQALVSYALGDSALIGMVKTASASGGASFTSSGQMPPLYDKRDELAHTRTMNKSTVDPIDQKLSSIEERMDKRMERMGEEFRREMRIRERASRREALAHHATLDAHIKSNDKAVTATLEALARTEAEFGKVKQANKEQRYWMAGIGVAIVLGIMGANATIFGGGKAFFDGGRDSITNQQNVESLINESRIQIQATQKMLEKIQDRQDALERQPAEPSITKPSN